MSNVIEFVKGDRKVLLSKDFVPLYGAVLNVLTQKTSGITRFGALKDTKVAAVLQGCKITKESDQVNEIGKAFSNLQLKGFISLTGDKVHTAKIVSDYADLAKEVIEVAEKTVVSTEQTTTAKRGRPAGSGKSATSKDNSVKRNPATAKAKRFWLVGGKVTPFGVGKPNKDKLLAECDEKGKNIADVAAINARFAQTEAKGMKVKRNPTQAATLRYYLKDGVVTPFGRGKPSFDKLNSECTQGGEKIDNSAVLSVMRQPKQASSTGGNASKIAGLEAQVALMAEMMKQMQAMMMGAAIPQPVQAVTVAPAAAEVAKVEAVQVPAKTAEKPAKPAKVAKVAKVAKPAKASKPSKAKAKSEADDDIDENDAYANFANISGDLSDDDPIAFGSDGFVVTEIDY